MAYSTGEDLERLKRHFRDEAAEAATPSPYAPSPLELRVAALEARLALLEAGQHTNAPMAYPPGHCQKCGLNLAGSSSGYVCGWPTCPTFPRVTA